MRSHREGLVEYMYLKKMSKKKYIGPNEVAFHLPAASRTFAHRKPVQRITSTQDGGFVVCSQEGLITFWSPSGHLRITKSFASPDIKRAKKEWVSDMVLMPEYNKIAVSAGGREIKMFEMSTFEASCQIHPLNSVPLRLDYCSTGADDCLILYGDNAGCINLIVINSVMECFRLWKMAPTVEGVPSVGIETIALGPKTKYVQWKAHGDWIKQLKYYHNINQIISCANHTNTALVIRSIYGSTYIDPPKGKNKAFRNYIAAKSKQIMQAQLGKHSSKPKVDPDQTVFKVYRGVTCFAFSKDRNIITGGLDRVVRIWNPYLSHTPTGVLRGHSAPVIYLFVEEEENRAGSVSIDRCVKVWDIQEQVCLLSFDQREHKISGQLQCCHYSSVTKTLVLTTDQLHSLPLKHKPVFKTKIPITHNQPIHAAVYNPVFKHLLTCSDASNIKVWDFETGNEILEFARAHGTAPITCMTLDRAGRRLITGGRDGCVRVWNYRNGHCMRTLQKPSDNKEVCALAHVEIEKSRFIISVGWDKRINMYSDMPADSIRLVQHPLSAWKHDRLDGHKEDILSVSQCPPNLLVTSSYDGEVIVWNMVSGHIFCHLRAPKPEGDQHQAFSGEESINKVLFLRNRASNKRAANLVASGPWRQVHIWNVSRGGILFARFLAARLKGSIISTMATNKVNARLYTADNYGFVRCWNIEKYCLELPEPKPPTMEASWRAHTRSVTAMSYIDEHQIVLTASLDCRVRLWTHLGQFIGTFGQPDIWQLGKPATCKQPTIPLDILGDVLSLPGGALKLADDSSLQETMGPITHKQTNKVIPKTDSGEDVDDSKLLDDQKIAKMIEDQQTEWKEGKRLRHEKYKPMKDERLGPSEYRMLRCFDLDQFPKPESPILLSVFRANID